MASKHPILQSGKLREGEKIALLKVTPKLVVLGPKPSLGCPPQPELVPCSSIRAPCGNRTS